MNYYCDYGCNLSKCLEHFWTLFQKLEIDVQLNVTAKVDCIY